MYKQTKVENEEEYLDEDEIPVKSTVDVSKFFEDERKVEQKAEIVYGKDGFPW